MTYRRLLPVSVVLGFTFAVAACQPGGKTLDLGIGKADEAPPAKITQSELRAHCPSVELREGTAFFNKYKSGAKKRAAEVEPLDDAAARPGDIVYQASIADVTRACAYSGGNVVMNVAVAGKIVPGAAFASGSIVMPIRVVVTRGGEVLYTQLHQYQVQVSDPTQATQFVFSDQEVIFPGPADRSIKVFAGYDEGAPAKKKPATQ
ncbi:MAG: hypothetical protein IPL47_16845 [Phyllobacteriaceae bacterium]|nr:hypothetical protein [Phyllobacteriaceae bacterium]